MSKLILDTIHIRQIHAGAFFKIGFLSNAFFWSSIMLVMGLFAVAGYDTVHWNGEHVHGISALVVSGVISFILSLLGSICLMLGGILAAWASQYFGFGEISIVMKTNDEQNGVGAE